MPTPCLERAMRQQLDNPALPIIVYLAAIGVLSVVSGADAPAAVERSTPGWLATTWALSLAVGGVLAVVACLTGRTRGESAGLAMLVFGIGLYAFAEAVYHWPVGIETSLALLALSGCCLLRMRVLRKARQAVAHVRSWGPPWTS